MKWNKECSGETDEKKREVARPRDRPPGRRRARGGFAVLSWMVGESEWAGSEPPEEGWARGMWWGLRQWLCSMKIAVMAGKDTCAEKLQSGWLVGWTPASTVLYFVNNCAHTLVVLFCVSSALVVRSFLPRFFSHGVLMLIFRVRPCLFASGALELMSAQFPLM